MSNPTQPLPSPTMAERMAAEAPPAVVHPPVDKPAPYRELPAPTNPMAVARKLAAGMAAKGGGAHRRYWNGEFYGWQGTRWEAVNHESMEKWLYLQTEHAYYTAVNSDGLPVIKDWAPNRRKIGDLYHALGVGVLHRETEPDQCIATTTGVLDPATRMLHPHMPERFNLYSLPFGYEPDAQCPRWLAFLESVLPGDKQAHDFLAEWFGYVISGRTDQQKMISLVGPPRCGKGTVARILEALLGGHSVASPTVEKLGAHFGEQALIGKRLAVMSDVRWNARAVAEAVPVLLAISGEDSREVPRKNRTDWHGRMDARFMLLSNDPPVFKDASLALANRMMHIQFKISFLGRENFGLERELRHELPGILNWALDGLDRLTKRGHFQPPASAGELDTEVRRASSPYMAFVEDWCELAPAEVVSVDTLLRSYREWCQKENRTLDQPTTASLSRGIRSAHAEVTVAGRKTMPDGTKTTMLKGLKVLRQPSWLSGAYAHTPQPPAPEPEPEPELKPEPPTLFEGQTES